MSSTTFNDKPFVVRSPDVTYTDDEMVSKYTYQVLRAYRLMSLFFCGRCVIFSCEQRATYFLFVPERVPRSKSSLLPRLRE